METPFRTDSNSGKLLKSQRCFNCLDFVVMGEAEDLFMTCPYCGAKQGPFFNEMRDGHPPILDDLFARLASDQRLQKKEHFLHQLRLWQYKQRKGINMEFEIRPLLIPTSSEGTLEFREVKDDNK